MKKNLLITLVSTFLVFGCTNKVGISDEKGNFSKWERTWNNVLTGEKLNKFKLFEQDDILISDKGNTSIYDDIYTFSQNEKNPVNINIPTYNDLLKEIGDTSYKKNYTRVFFAYHGRWKISKSGDISAIYN